MPRVEDLCNDVYYCTDDDTIRIIKRYLYNIACEPHTHTYRTIKLNNKKFKHIWNYQECRVLFYEIGFIVCNDVLNLSMDASLDALNYSVEFFRRIEKEEQRVESLNLMHANSAPDGVSSIPVPCSIRQTDLHLAAARGDALTVRTLLQAHSDWVHVRDENGWQPLHEAARAGAVEVVQLLMEAGADVTATTSNGASALWWAEEYFPLTHPCVSKLRELQHKKCSETLVTVNNPPHSRSPGLPSNNCMICFKIIRDFGSGRRAGRFLSRSPHPDAAIECVTCKYQKQETIKDNDNQNAADYVVCGECYDFGKHMGHASDHRFDVVGARW